MKILTLVPNQPATIQLIALKSPHDDGPLPVWIENWPINFLYLITQLTFRTCNYYVHSHNAYHASDLRIFGVNWCDLPVTLITIYGLIELNLQSIGIFPTQTCHIIIIWLFHDSSNILFTFFYFLSYWMNKWFFLIVLMFTICCKLMEGKISKSW